jgi:site-specific DNA-methyltransferase (cytosine-N4-specific)
MQQLSFFPDAVKQQTHLKRTAFSHDGICSEDARIALEGQYGHLLEETDEFNRQLVSFQANRTETLHSWIKYREGFSADLVEILMGRFGIGPGDTILDPFAGSGTTLLVAKMMGVDAAGVELLPHCHLAWDAKSRAFDYDLDELWEIRSIITETTPPVTNGKFPHLTITRSAFPEQTERDLMAYTRWIETLGVSEDAQVLCRLILTSILEQISYTRKDGQYLRWDGRAQKIIERNNKRIAEGKRPFKGIHKGELPGVKDAFLKALSKIIFDVIELQRELPSPSHQKMIAGNTLYVLPEMAADQFAGVITSPPYANRYDYTRTYALELAYLSVGKKIFNLRQRQLSCTVENKTKLNELEEWYRSTGRYDRYKLTFVFAELYRVCRGGAHVAFVNDNVGESHVLKVR